MGPAWDRQNPGGPHVGHMNPAIWEQKRQQNSTVLTIVLGILH